MKTFSYILAFIFVSFLFAPSIITLIDKNADISIAFNIDEEENSSKNQISLEYDLEKMDSNYESIHFLQIQKEDAHYYKESRYKVFLKITSPPPQRA